MRSLIVRRGGMLALAAVAALLAGVAPASAAPGDGLAYGVAVDVSLLGNHVVDVGPLSAARTSGPTHASAATANVRGVLAAGVIDTSAVRDDDTGAVTSRASTADVAVPLLSAIGRVTAKAIVAKCVATQSGETGSTTLVDAHLGRLGALAATPAPNTRISIRLPLVGNVATLILNERVHHADGSLTVTAFHLHLLGGHGVGAIGSGDVIISSATCGPAALPMPVASGAGLWIGLGLLAAIGVPVGATVVRKRRASAASAA